MRITDTSDLWWKTAVIYCLDVETFLDWDGDGVGDFAGLAQRIDYLAELGVTCLWLMPFSPSPNRDDGYDVADFYGVDPRLGTAGDLVEAIVTANDRGIRVIADLVVNHTSDRHPWFQAARADRGSRYRDYYVWRDEPLHDGRMQPVFPDQEQDVWTFDEVAGQYYLHRFSRHQPDLNVGNPAVREEIGRVIGYWLRLGVAGFRVDAVPFLLETTGMSEEDRRTVEPHGFLRSLRSFVGRRSGSGILLGEVNLPYEEQVAYFGHDAGDELTMQFDFVGMQHLYLALARGDADPLATALRGRPPLATHCQWATFLRNHDELTLDQLCDGERREVFEQFGPEPDMQIFGRGLRRRLPPMLGGDARRLRMAYSLLFSLPGTPVLFYGEEIGMGENLDAPGRHAVRTPMQWSDDVNGGFSTAAADRLPTPVVAGRFGPGHVNVAAQRRDPDSLLNFVTRLAQRYRECPELGWGAVEVVEQPHRSVLAHRCTWDDASLTAVHNFGAEPVSFELPVDGATPGSCVVDLLGARGELGTTEVRDGVVTVELDGYGYRWLRLVRPGDRRLV